MCIGKEKLFSYFVYCNGRRGFKGPGGGSGEGINLKEGKERKERFNVTFTFVDEVAE
jgi:hypothetical protein